MTISNDIKPPKGSKQHVRKRKRDGTSSEHSSPTSPNESGKRNKRATRACERCRNKKIKCDIERDIACNACVDANVVCEAGNGKHTEDKKYPPGYTESLENTYQAMVLVIDKLWRMVKSREEWTLSEPRMKDGGKGPVVIHDIAQALGCIRNAPGLPECFIEDAPALLTRLSAEEMSKVKKEVQTEGNTSTEELSSEQQLKCAESLPEFQVESPVELPPPSYSSHFPPTSEKEYFNTTKPSIPLQLQSPKSLPSPAPISRSVAIDQRPDTSSLSHEASMRSARTSQNPSVNMPHVNMMNNLPSKFSTGTSFSGRNPAALDSRRAPGLTIQPYHYQEQSTLSASTVSSFSPTYQANSPFQSTVSSFSPAYQAHSPLTSSENSYQTDSSSSSSPYLDTLQKDPYLSPNSPLGDFSEAPFHDLNTLLLNKQATSSYFDRSPYLEPCDTIFDLDFNDLSGYSFSAEDEFYSRELCNI